MIKVAWLAPYNVLSLFPDLFEGRCAGIVHASSWIRNLADGLSSRRDIELHVITESPFVPAGVSIRRQNGVVFHVLKSGIPFARQAYPSFFPVDIMTCYAGNVRRLVKEISNVRPDVVHSHGTEAAYSLAGLKSGIPCLVSVQGIVSEIFKVSPSPHAWIVGRLERWQVARAKYFGCRTDFDRGFVRSINDTARIFQINEAVDQCYFDKQWKIAGTRDLLFVGSLCRRKGVETLLDAMAMLKRKFSDIKLKLVGEGKLSYVEFLKRKAGSLGLDGCVEFSGFLPAQRIAELHMQSQVFILPTEVDNSPNSLAEAMVSGLPIVATRVGGIPSMVQHNETAYLVEPRDPSGLAEGVRYLLENPAARSDISRKARIMGREGFCTGKVVEQAMDAYHQILTAEEGKQDERVK